MGEKRNPRAVIGTRPLVPVSSEGTSAIIDSTGGAVAQLVVRKLDPKLVAELRKRAARNGRSMEAEHRELLRQALRPGRQRASLKDLLLKMPAVGEDVDFARERRKARPVRL